MQGLGICISVKAGTGAGQNLWRSPSVDRQPHPFTRPRIKIFTSMGFRGRSLSRGRDLAELRSGSRSSVQKTVFSSVGHGPRISWRCETNAGSSHGKRSRWEDRPEAGDDRGVHGDALLRAYEADPPLPPERPSIYTALQYRIARSPVTAEDIQQKELQTPGPTSAPSPYAYGNIEVAPREKDWSTRSGSP